MLCGVKLTSQGFHGNSMEIPWNLTKKTQSASIHFNTLTLMHSSLSHQVDLWSVCRCDSVWIWLFPQESNPCLVPAVLQRAPTVENEWSEGARRGVAVPIRSKSCVLRSVTCFTKCQWMSMGSTNTTCLIMVKESRLRYFAHV